jgi:nicotinamidase-related amidase
MLTRENTALVVVDIQEKLGSKIQEIDYVVSNTNKLIRACDILKVPVVYTEQYPKGLGKSLILGAVDPIEKTSFDCFGEPEFVKNIKKLRVKNLVVTGIEAHVCVLQTLITGISKGFKMHIVVDAVSSRNVLDKDVSILRAKQEGAKLTTAETVIFQLVKKAGTEEFKEISELIKGKEPNPKS